MCGGSVLIPDSITPDMIRLHTFPTNKYELWPQMAESYYFLWRETHLQKYRDYAWRLAQAIDKHARKDLNTYPSPWFLDATPKYLYLIFSDDQLLPSDQWIFNNAGHPLPIYGKNAMYAVKNQGKLP